MYVCLCLFQVCHGCIVSELNPKNDKFHLHHQKVSSYEPRHHGSKQQPLQREKRVIPVSSFCFIAVLQVVVSKFAVSCWNCLGELVRLLTMYVLFLEYSTLATFILFCILRTYIIGIKAKKNFLLFMGKSAVRRIWPFLRFSLNNI